MMAMMFVFLFTAGVEWAKIEGFRPICIACRKGVGKVKIARPLFF